MLESYAFFSGDFGTRLEAPWSMVLLLHLATVSRLAAGILAVQDPGVTVDPVHARAYAEAALAAAEAQKVDPWEVIGVARIESRFRADEVGTDGKDCGIMQTRVTGSRYKCRELRRNVEIAFAEGARELAAYRDSCRKHSDFDRCRFNRYNSGVRYARHGFHGSYWLRVQCFSEAARAGEPGAGCLDVRSRGAIARAIHQPYRSSKFYATARTRTAR
jgi:hypothetical protein